MSDNFVPKSEHVYTLTTPIPEIANKGTGEVEEIKFITLHAPSSKVIQECAALKQAFFQAMQEQQEKASPTDTEADVGDIEGHEVMSLIAMSSVDMPSIMDVAKKLFTAPGIAMANGEIKFGTAVMDKMTADDFEEMLGEYLVNFTLASSLMRLKSKSSKASPT